MEDGQRAYHPRAEEPLERQPSSFWGMAGTFSSELLLLGLSDLPLWTVTNDVVVTTTVKAQAISSPELFLLCRHGSRLPRTEGLGRDSRGSYGARESGNGRKWSRRGGRSVTRDRGARGRIGRTGTILRGIGLIDFFPLSLTFDLPRSQPRIEGNDKGLEIIEGLEVVAMSSYFVFKLLGETFKSPIDDRALVLPPENGEATTEIGEVLNCSPSHPTCSKITSSRSSRVGIAKADLEEPRESDSGRELDRIVTFFLSLKERVDSLGGQTGEEGGHVAYLLSLGLIGRML